MAEPGGLGQRSLTHGAVFWLWALLSPKQTFGDVWRQLWLSPLGTTAGIYWLKVRDAAGQAAVHRMGSSSHLVPGLGSLESGLPVFSADSVPRACSRQVVSAPEDKNPITYLPGPRSLQNLEEATSGTPPEVWCTPCTLVLSGNDDDPDSDRGFPQPCSPPGSFPCSQLP